MKLAIIFGANSYEHEVSIVSAITLKRLLRGLIFIFIDARREFYLIDEKDMKANFFSSYTYKKCPKLSLSHGGFKTQGLFSKKIDANIYLNLVHGQDGEDGKLPALFEFFDLAYIGPNIPASVLSYDKELSKSYASSCGVKTLYCEVLRSKEEAYKLSLPFIIKPARLGSSIGISVIEDKNQIDYAMDVAMEFDSKIIAEPFIKNLREFNLAGFWDGEKLVFSMLEEVKKEGFLDFEQKYLDFTQKKIEPAAVEAPLLEKFHEAFRRIYDPLFRGALIRCDFFLIDGEVFLNEINPNPGSLANYLFDDFKGAVESLAKAAKTKSKIKINYAFINELSHAKGGKNYQKD